MRNQTIPEESTRVIFHARITELRIQIEAAAKARFEAALAALPVWTRDTVEAAADRAIQQGVGVGCSLFNQYGIEEALLMAHAILEDSNVHTEAAPLWAALQELKSKR